MTILDFLVLALAASALVDVWSNGSIFAEPRAYFEVRADAPHAPVASEPLAKPEEESLDGSSSWWMRVCDRIVPRLLAELLSCSFCFSHHTPWMLALVCYFPAFFISQPWLVFLMKLPAYSLAATRLGNITNACLPQGSKYEREQN